MCCVSDRMALGQRYQVYGHLSFTYYDTRGKQVEQGSDRFIVKVEDRAWDIKITPVGPDRDYRRISFDGTNMYILHDLQNAVATLKKKGKHVAANLATGFVVQKAVPCDFVADGIGEVWLTYASADYFKNLKEGVPVQIPFWQMPGHPVLPQQIVERRAFWSISKRGMSLPNYVAYLTKDGRSTNAEFSANSFGDFEGHHLPESANFKVFYEPGFAGFEPKYALRARYLVKAEQFHALSSNLSFPPSVPALTEIFDSRFSASPENVATIVYQTDGRFLTKSGVMTLPKDHKLLLHLDPTQSHFENVAAAPTRPEIGKWLVGAFILFNIIFVVSYMRRLKKTTKANTKPTTGKE